MHGSSHRDEDLGTLTFPIAQRIPQSELAHEQLTMYDLLSAPTKRNAYLFLTLTMLFWAGNYTLGRWANGHVPPITLAFFRWVGATLLILPLAWPQLCKDWPLIRENWLILLVLGATGSGLFNTLQYIALTETSATNAGIINSSAPVLIVMMSWLINTERIHARQAIGIGVSLVGVLCVLSRGDPKTLSDFSFNSGDLTMLIAMVVWSLYAALLSKRPSIAFFSFACVIYLVAALLNAGLACVEMSQGAEVVWSLASASAILYTIIFPSFLAYLFFNRAVEILGPAKASPFMHLVPFFTMVLAIVFLGEELALYHGIGLLLILSGIWLTTTTEDENAL